MSKYESSLSGPTPWKVHGGQYKTADVDNATRGRVIIDPKRSLATDAFSRPAGRTSFLAGDRTASTNAQGRGGKY